MGDLGGHRRYAVYYAPEATSDLARLGASWLGRDARGGGPDAGPASEASFDGVDPVIRRDATARPARYGFHATLKAPFQLAEGRAVADLDDEIAAFAARTPPARGPKLGVADLHGFLALRTQGPAPEIDALARAVVEAFDAFRAPLDEADRARRLAAGLDARELELLERWGYPYVDDRFHFHMTLTGRVSPVAADALASALGPAFDAAARDPFELDRLCLFGDPGDGAPFRLLSEHPLTG